MKFVAPASGPSGTFGGGNVVFITTDSSGVAFAIFTANTTAGDLTQLVNVTFTKPASVRRASSAGIPGRNR